MFEGQIYKTVIEKCGSRDIENFEILFCCALKNKKSQFSAISVGMEH